MQDVLNYTNNVKNNKYEAKNDYFLSIQDVKAVHKVVVDEMFEIFEKKANVKLDNKYEIINEPLLKEILDKKYKTIEDKAASILYTFCKKEIFHFANMRVGVVLCDYLLIKNGLELDITDEELYNLAIDAHIGDVKKTDFKQIIKDKIEKPKQMTLEDYGINL